MTRIAVLGLGAMGSRMAGKLTDAGHSITVWNRSAERAEPFFARGAAVGETPRAAAAGADVVIAMVRDDEASQAVWLGDDGALAAMRPGTVAIESSTLSLAWINELHGHCRSADVALLDAPVAGSRPQADAGQLIYFVGGEADVLARAEPVLAAMGGVIHAAGPAGSGAALKLAVNALFGIQVAALAELLPMLEHAGVDLGRASEILGSTPVASAAAKGAAAGMLARAFAPQFPTNLVEKDFGYALAAASKAPLTEAARAVYARAIREGMGGDNLTGIIRLYEEKPVSSATST